MEYSDLLNGTSILEFDINSKEVTVQVNQQVLSNKLFKMRWIISQFKRCITKYQTSMAIINITIYSLDNKKEREITE